MERKKSTGKRRGGREGRGRNVVAGGGKSRNRQREEGEGKEERTGTGEEDGPLSVDRTRSCRIERVDLTL